MPNAICRPRKWHWRNRPISRCAEDLQKTVLDITKQIAAEKKYNLIVSGAQVLYADDALDITDEVIKRLDAKMPTVSVK